MSVKLTKETFEPLLNTKFKITFDIENIYEVELIELEEGKPFSKMNSIPFTLTFRGAATEKIFAQGMYKIYSEITGELPLFLIPRMPDEEGIYYDVIIS